MKKIGIISLYDNNNYGNKLQNYAVQEIIRKNEECEPITIKNKYIFPLRTIFIQKVKKIVKIFLIPFVKKYREKFFLILKNKEIQDDKKNEKLRYQNFERFDRKIKKTDYFENVFSPSKKLNQIYDLFIVGSDQVFNPNWYGLNEIPNLYLLRFADKTKKISFAASFGTNKVSKKVKKNVAKDFESYKAISVREESGKEIINDITGRQDVEVLLDPTMFLSSTDWDKIIEKPNQISKLCPNGEKFILNYFLGTDTYNNQNKNEIEKIAKENNCKIINILDKNDPFYVCGPSEFIWLEKNAFIICTDSFHSSVFAIIYNKPFIVFKRKEKFEQINNKYSMNSRLDNLLKKFGLEDRYFTGSILPEMLTANYFMKDNVLKEEYVKMDNFLKKALSE